MEKHGKRQPPRRRRHGAGLPLAARWALLLAWAAFLVWFCLWSFGCLPGRGRGEQPVSADPFRPAVGEPPYTVAVDAGHGGTDPGAAGVVVEREMTAETAAALVRWLEDDPNYIPVATRDSYDATAKPSERAARASAQHAELLLSIHGNSAPAGSTAQGFECYPVVPGRTWHQESYYFAGLLAQGMQAAGAPLRGTGGIRYIYYLESGEKKIVETTDGAVRKEQTFTILEEAGCPAVLAEQCFVTSAADVDRFGDAEGCKRAARLYYEAICGYFGTEPLPG